MSQYYKSVLGNKVLQRTTQYHIVLGSTTTYYKALRITKIKKNPYCKVLRSTTCYYKAPLYT